MPIRTSLIVVNFDGGREAVDNLALLSESEIGDGVELLIVDNCSTDGSADLIEAEVPAARVIRRPCNAGYASAVNQGLAEAVGDILIILNADVRPRPGALGELADAVASDREVAIVGGVTTDARGVRSPNVARMLPNPLDILREALFLPPRRVRFGRREAPAGVRGRVVRVPAVSGAVMAVTRESLERLGPMDQEYFLYNEDLDWCRRAQRARLAVGVAPRAIFEHAGGASTRKNEGAAFAARVLADFHYFCDGADIDPERIRRLWRLRLVLRSWMYRVTSTLDRSPERGRTSRRRASVYSLLARRLADYEWSQNCDEQSCDPARLIDLPSPGDAREDRRPLILHVIPNMDYGGAQRLVETIVTGPLSGRFRFEILCLTHRGQIGDRLRESGVPVMVAGLSGWRSPGDWRAAADFAALIDADVVHSHTLAGDIASYVGFAGRAVRISTKHSIDAWMSPFVRAVERHVLRGATVLAVGDGVARAKACLGPRGMLPRVVESPPAVPLATAPAPLFTAGRPVRVTFLGRLHRVKRVDLFLRTVAELQRRSPGRFAFRVVGDGPDEPALRSMAEELGVSPAVDFRGAVSNVAAVLDDSDVVPLLSDYEGIVLTVLETLARGRVPLVRRTPGADESLPACLDQCYVDSDSPCEFADRLIEIADHPERFAALADRGRGWVAGRPEYSAIVGRIYDESLERAPRRRRRVLHVITRLIVGGAQENTIASVARVDPARYESHLWTGPETGSEGSLIADARARGIVLGILPNLVREIRPLTDAAMLLQLTNLLRRGEFDIIHTHSSKAGIVGRVAARLAGVPHIVHTVHGWGFHDHMHPALRAFYIALERMMEPWTRPLISVSERTTGVGLAAGIGGPESYRLIRSGIPLARFHPDPSSREVIRADLGLVPTDVVVGSVGRLSPQKNPADFVRVAERLCRGRDHLRFVYVGDGPLRDEIESAVDAAGLNGRVLLLGIRGDVPDLLRAMDVFILTSLWEGLPRVVLQALATGVPVVAYDTAGIEEAVSEGRNGHLVSPGDVETMAARLSVLVDDETLRAGMSAAAAGELDRSFTEDAMIADLERLYDELSGPGIS
ncbi:MAG: glycosyltransferase [Candidatus Eisenbacteria bacterium]|nr:glycosyltransferase [Candidatus Eisenbacteria bacterium]